MASQQVLTLLFKVRILTPDQLTQFNHFSQKNHVYDCKRCCIRTRFTIWLISPIVSFGVEKATMTIAAQKNESVRHPAVRLRGVIALLMLVCIWGFLGVIPKYLSQHLPVLQQLYLRLGFGALISLVLLSRSAMRQMPYWPKKEWLLLFIRSVLYYSVGAVLYNFSLQHTLVANAAFASALPFTAVFGFIFFGEHLTIRKACWLGVSLFAVVVLFWSRLAVGRAGFGEILALLSGAAISLAMLLRRQQGPIVTDAAAGAVMLSIACLITIGHSAILGDGMPSFDWPTPIWGVLFLGSILIAGMSFVMNYGFARVEPALANTILTLDAPTSALFGAVFFHELPDKLGVFAALLIVLSIVGMQREEAAHG